MVYLRARYYDPAMGRFFTRDMWEGDVNTPASLNRFAYAHNNPVMNTDPSGNCIFTGADTIACALAAVGIGFVSGAVIGGAFGAMTYTWALAGECGCEMQDAAIKAGSRWAFAGSLALSGGIIGGVMGGIAALAPIGLIAVSGLGVVMSGADFVKTVNIIRNEVGKITPCTAMRLMMDVTGIVLGGMGVAKGVQAWRASGSGLSWVKKPGPIDTPDSVYCSFTEDTEVTTSEGDTPISEIQIGDYVLAWNEETGEIDWYPVTAKMAHDDPILVHLTLDGEEITTTPEHPFYTEEDGWVAAGELIAGMHVRKADGSFGEIDATHTEESTQRMYNLTVDEAHTYFVGEGQWLVHNVCVRGLSGDVTNDPHGQWLVDEAIRYHKAVAPQENITIAVAEHNGQKVVALNGKASNTTYLKLLRITSAEHVKLIYKSSPQVEYHAERILFDRLSVRTIGISNSSTGPCPGSCQPFFQNKQNLGLFDELYYPASYWPW